jgi:signal transduction histidine kinase
LEDAGPIRGFAIIMQDVTERRKIAIVLEEARQERARLQEKLLSHVSHELRTPLTAIYFFTPMYWMDYLAI